METEGLKKYVGNSNERLLKAVDSEGILGDGKTKKEILTKRKKNLRKKLPHRWFTKKTDEVRSQETWNRLKIGLLKNETECKWLHKTKH